MMQLTLFFVTLWALSSQNIAQAEDPFPPVSYDKRLRPSAGKTAHEEVTVNTLIKEILSVDETTQTSELDVYVTLKWKDSRLKWDVQKEGRIQKRLEADSVWVPGIDFDNAVGSHLLGKQSLFVQGDSGLVEFRRRFQVGIAVALTHSPPVLSPIGGPGVNTAAVCKISVDLSCCKLLADCGVQQHGFPQLSF